MKATIIRILMLISSIALFIYCGYLKFQNPDMTETRLLLTYWKEYLAIIAGIAAELIVLKVLDE